MKLRIQKMLVSLVPFALMFALTFCGLRVFEWLSLREDPELSRLEALGFLYDVQFSFLLISIVGIISLLVGCIHVQAGRITSIVLGTLFLLCGFSVIQYFVETRIPLSADLFAYSISDIRTTVQSSGGFSILTILALITYLTVFAGGMIYIYKNAVFDNLRLPVAASILCIIVTGALLPFNPQHKDFSQDNQYFIVVNKLEYFSDRAFKYFRDGNKNTIAFDKDSYPFLRTVPYNNVLGQYLEKSNELPHFVFIIVEGLGRDFTGPDAQYGGFTPFLDSLANKSLYWKNGISNAGRTFGVLPSILGSLPYGKDGFMSYGNTMPDHQTLISLLKEKGYTSNFFYGGNPNFDNQDIFLQYQGLDYMLNETNFPASYRKAAASADGFTWGYGDRDVFNYSHEVITERRNTPRLDIYLTLSTHEPFICPEQKFIDRVDTELSRLNDKDARQRTISEYKNVFACLSYTDDALREFFLKYRNLPEFSKTIFIISGDHRLIPIPQDTRISRYHVPVMIYSELLKSPEQFESLVTHSDIPVTILSYLKDSYNMNFPSELPMISNGMTASKQLSSSLDLALIRNKGEVNDYIAGEHFLSEGRLYKIGESLTIQEIEDGKLREEIQLKLETFNSKSRFACENNRLDKKGNKGSLQLLALSQEDEAYIQREKLSELVPEQLFNKARTLTFDKKYEESRIILIYLLNTAPNYHEARILLGRTFAWNGEYDTAQYYFDDVLKRAPTYDEAFVALSDLEYWKGNSKRSMELTEKGLVSHPQSAELLARKARGYLIMGQKDEAHMIAASVLKTIPQHEIALDVLKKSKQ